VAQLWTAVLIATLLAVLASVMVARAQQGVGIVLGFVVAALCGGAGAVFILRQRMDVVPDDVERAIAAVLILIGSIVFIIATWLRLLRG
jgi:hypothetical protein